MRRKTRTTPPGVQESRRTPKPTTRPLLYIVFRRDDRRGSRQLKDAEREPWTAPRETQPGDVALFYLTGPKRGIWAIGRAATKAELGEPGEWAKGDRRAYFVQHTNVILFSSPVTLDELRNQFPKWTFWNNLRGRRAHLVPEEYRAQLARIVAEKIPSARDLLSSWLSRTEERGQPRYDSWPRSVTTVRRLVRDSAFGKRVRQKSGGRCAACAADTDYEKLGILQAAHIRPVEQGGPDELRNALALCPNHHALFDEGFWTVDHKDGRKIVLRPTLPPEIKQTFDGQLRCNWSLDPKELKWHQENVFNKPRKLKNSRRTTPWCGA